MSTHIRSATRYLKAASALQQGDYVYGILRYTIVALGILAFYLTALFLLIDKLGWTPQLATIAAYFACSLLSLSAHAAYTFRAGHFGAYDVIKYLVAGVLGALASGALVDLLHHRAGLPLLIPALLSCLLAPFIGFCVLNFVIFGKLLMSRGDKNE